VTPTQTPFCGYELLQPGDPLSSDGYRFQAVNPSLADRVGRIGAETHQHDGHAAMANPSLAATLGLAAGAGSFPSGVTVSAAYTLVDADGGETLPSAVLTVATPAGYLTPLAAPTLAVDYTAGTLLASNLDYAATVSDGRGGETALGPMASIVVAPGNPLAEVTISGLAALLTGAENGDTSGTWRLWRSQGGGPWYLVSTGTADSFLDNGVAGDCSVAPPSVGTTLGTSAVTVVVPSGQPAAAVTFNVYLSLDGTFTSPALMGAYPVSDLGTVLIYAAYLPTAGSPPPVSTCFGGANQINPDTDILDWTWKRTVATVADLPTVGNEDGDARVSLDTHLAYVWDATSSTWLAPPDPSADTGDGTFTTLVSGEIQLLGSSGVPAIPADGAVTNPTDATSGGTRKVTGSLAGDGTTSVFTVTHGLGSSAIQVVVQTDNSGVPGAPDPTATWAPDTDNGVDITFATAPLAGIVSYVTVYG
jgi:hypothetical protein